MEKHVEKKQINPIQEALSHELKYSTAQTMIMFLHRQSMRARDSPVIYQVYMQGIT